MNKKEWELRNCSAVKVFLMLFVVAYHCCVFWTGTWFTKDPLLESRTIALIAKWMNSFHIYGFFLISGYIFFYTVCENDRYKSYGTFLKKKIKRLIIPYIFTAIIWVIPFSVIFLKLQLGGIVRNYILATAPNQLWFLLVLFWISNIFYIANSYIKGFPNAIMILLILFYVVGIYMEGKGCNYFQIFTTFRCAIFFFIGYRIRQDESDFLYQIPSTVYIIINGLLFAVLCYIDKNDFFLSGVLVQGIEFLLRIEGAVASFVVLQRIVQRSYMISNRIFKYCIKISMPIYLFHQQLVYISIRLLNGKISPGLHVVVNFIFVLSISALISSLLLKNRITCFWIGERYSMTRKERNK